MAGIQWGKGAVGNARWTGVRMADVLKTRRRQDDRPLRRHERRRSTAGHQPDFVRQLPIDKAMHADTLIAYEMNGQPIPPLHGFPLRAIVPGWEGAYSMKWLTNLRVIDREFDGFWVATGYRYPTKRVAPGAAVDPKDMAPLTGSGRQVADHAAARGAVVAPGKVEVAGFAWAGETDIARVDVSTDTAPAGSRRGWPASGASTPGGGSSTRSRRARPESYLILSRATDANGRTQPMAPPWNPSGYLWNAPDSVRIEVKA